VVIGRGTMLFNGVVDQFVREFTQSTVIVRSPSAAAFTTALEGAGAQVAQGKDGELVVSGMEIGAVGHLAFTEHVELAELSTRSASLEEAFMSATGASEEFVAAEPLAAVPAASAPAPSTTTGGADHA
jgi:ABC-2 type transport system ATP-binding protein